MINYRFEAKHQFFKRVIGAVKNYKNVSKTLSSRHQYYNVYCNINPDKDIVFGKRKYFNLYC